MLIFLIGLAALTGYCQLEGDSTLRDWLGGIALIGVVLAGPSACAAGL